MVAMNKIIIDDLEIEYVINYKKIKNIYFRVKEDNILYVSCNKLVSKKEIEKLLLDNKKFIIKSLKRIDNINEENNKIYYLGNELKLVIDDNLYIDNNCIHAKNISEAKDYIYSLAYEVFDKRLKMIMLMFKDLPKFILKTRKMTSKWGVCNKRSMSVTLNTELITKDVHLIDYVIVHELCHFKHMNHSDKFWDEVKKYYPYYKQARKELNNR